MYEHHRHLCVIIHHHSFISYTKLQYAEFRSGYNKDTEDTRLVWYGIRYVLETYVCRRWTMQDIERADAFYKYVFLLFLI